MDITSRTYGDVVVVEPAGRIDYPAGAEFERSLLALTNPSAGADAGLVVDMQGVTYIGSVGLRVLLVAAKALHARAVRIAVANVQPTVREIMAIAHFETVVEIFPTLNDAIGALSSNALAAYRAANEGRSP